MTSYTVTQRTPLFQAANMASPRLGIAEGAFDIEGAVDTGGFVKTRIDSVPCGDGFISILALADRPTLPQPIPDDLVGVFIALVTRMARDLETDRDYLLAVAYAGTNNLKALGGAADARLGPFQYTRRSGRTRSPPARRGTGFCGRTIAIAGAARPRSRPASPPTPQNVQGCARPIAQVRRTLFHAAPGRDGIRSPEGRSKRQMQRRHQGTASGIVRRRLAAGVDTIASALDKLNSACWQPTSWRASRSQAAARDPLLPPRRGRGRAASRLGHRRPGGDGARRLGDAGKQEQR